MKKNVLWILVALWCLGSFPLVAEDENSAIPEMFRIDDDEGQMAFYFDRDTRVFRWVNPGGLPLVKGGILDPTALREFVESKKFEDAVKVQFSGGNVQTLVEEARAVVRDAKWKFLDRENGLAPRESRSLFLSMAFGVKGDPSGIQKRQMVLWAGKQSLAVWRLPLQKNQFDIDIPVVCGNVAFRTVSYFVETKPECGEWKSKIIKTERVGDEMEYTFWLYRECLNCGAEKPLCDDMQVKTRAPIEKREVPVEKLVLAPCDPCQLPEWKGKTWQIAGVYWPRVSKAPKVELAKLLSNAVPFWGITDSDFQSKVRELAVGHLKSHPDFRKLKWDEKTKTFRRKVQAAILLYDVCTNEVRMYVYWEGWHWKEYWIGKLAGFGIGFPLGWIARGEQVITITKNPFFNPATRPMTFQSGSGSGLNFPQQIQRSIPGLDYRFFPQARYIQNPADDRNNDREIARHLAEGRIVSVKLIRTETLGDVLRRILKEK